MSLTRKDVHLRKAENIYDIPEFFDWGSKYRRDPLGGKLDYMTHPTRLQDNIDNERLFGDCDDHAIYWATVLKKSNLADRVWFGYYSMLKKGNGLMSAHALCIYEKDGQEYWCDYRLPNKVEKNEWMVDSADIYDCNYVAAAKIEIEDVDMFDTPKFGKTEIFLNKDLK
tara:strand:- start:608 stop:1114 length:507 start_codon:yes stop_codon:yes gene_type:complete